MRKEEIKPKLYGYAGRRICRKRGRIYLIPKENGKKTPNNRLQGRQELGGFQGIDLRPKLIGLLKVTAHWAPNGVYAYLFPPSVRLTYN